MDLSRRGFLALGAGGLAAAALVVVRPWDLDGGSKPLADLFGEQRAAVAAMGGSALVAGVVADRDDALAVLPASGRRSERTSNGSVVLIDDRSAFVAAYDRQVAAELAAGSLVFVEGYPLTPTEAALAAVVHLDAA